MAKAVDPLDKARERGKAHLQKILQDCMCETDAKRKHDRLVLVFFLATICVLPAGVRLMCLGVAAMYLL